MREIKFSYIQKTDDGYEETIQTLDEIESGSDALILAQKDRYGIIARRQYTGLKDKNGLEIYEGDILATENHENLDRVDEWSDTDWGYGVVEFDLPNGIRVTNNFWLTWDKDDNSVFNIEHVKVIGNIYQNPELTKDT